MLSRLNCNFKGARRSLVNASRSRINSKCISPRLCDSLAAFQQIATFSEASEFGSHKPWTQWERRPKMVILGSGWAAVNLIQNLDARALSRYNILVCSPVNHFVNTPLLPSVTVGTLGPRAIMEPVRNFLAAHRKKHPDSWIKFNEVEATKVDHENKRLLVSTRGVDGRASFQSLVKSMPSATVKSDYWIEYDVLVCAVGATTNTFGTPGALEHCTFLKTVQDAMKIRTTLLDCFETAAVMGTPDEEIDRLLNFVIIGAGPTGVEIAAEIRDFVQEDVLPRYSYFKGRNVSVKVVEMTPKMLGTYDKIIQDYCADRFKKQDIGMLTEHRVTKVNARSVEAINLSTGEAVELPFGMCVWASGVRPSTISLDMAKDIQGSRILEVDGNLRVLGAQGSVFAMGDCAKITHPKMRDQAHSLFDQADVNKDGVLDMKEFQTMMEKARKDYPHLEAYLGHVCNESISIMYKNFGQVVTFDMFDKAVAEVDKELKMLPPTAQVAAQQGQYLATIINNVELADLGHEEGFKPRFEYKHAGSMAYIGGETAAIDSPVFGINTGLLTYALWKGVYWGKSVSLIMKFNMITDWAKSWFLGRDTSRF